MDETFLYRTEKKAIQAILLVWALVTILASPLVPAHGLYQINKEQVPLVPAHGLYQINKEQVPLVPAHGLYQIN